MVVSNDVGSDEGRQTSDTETYTSGIISGRFHAPATSATLRSLERRVMLHDYFHALAMAASSSTTTIAPSATVLESDANGDRPEEELDDDECWNYAPAWMEVIRYRPNFPTSAARSFLRRHQQRPQDRQRQATTTPHDDFDDDSLTAVPNLIRPPRPPSLSDWIGGGEIENDHDDQEYPVMTTRNRGGSYVATELESNVDDNRFLYSTAPQGSLEISEGETHFGNVFTSAEDVYGENDEEPEVQDDEYFDGDVIPDINDIESPQTPSSTRRVDGIIATLAKWTDLSKSIQSFQTRISELQSQVLDNDGEFSWEVLSMSDKWGQREPPFCDFGTGRSTNQDDAVCIECDIPRRGNSSSPLECEDDIVHDGPILGSRVRSGSDRWVVRSRGWYLDDADPVMIAYRNVQMKDILNEIEEAELIVCGLLQHVIPIAR